MSSVNADSMANQGEFQPSRPRDKPLAFSGHQVGKQVGNDAVPEFRAQTLPAGSAPASKTFKPNPENEVPGQADNADAMNGRDGKESTYSDPLNIPGATSRSVHTGIGHPGQGQTSNELRNNGEHSSRRQRGTMDREGGSGLTGEPNAEAKRLMTDKAAHGPTGGHGVDREGAEDKEAVRAEELASS